jgi:hypothetical protein
LISLRNKPCLLSGLVSRLPWYLTLKLGLTPNEQKFDAISQFPTVFVGLIPDSLSPLRQINHRIRLKDPDLTINMPQYLIGHNLLPKLKAWINKQMRAGILYRTETPGAASMFVQPKSDGRIRPFVDFRKIK